MRKIMEERNLKSWTEFKPAIDEIRKKYGYHEFGEVQTYKQKNTILFRGHASSKWQLQTTLERKTDQKFTLMQYLLNTRKRIYELEAYTGTKWDLPSESSLRKIVGEQADKMFGPDSLPCYPYLAYLRHHGYPSPLLDWSESPYIAAYFSMCDANPNENHVAVFVYIESTNSGKDFYGEGEPLIQTKGSRITTHKRHFMQKACYTVALKWSEERQAHIFCSHHEIFDKHNPNQDILIKITLPTSEKKSVLKDLDDYNINHFTLFQSEDALVKWLGIKDFDYKDA